MTKRSTKTHPFSVISFILIIFYFSSLSSQNHFAVSSEVTPILKNPCKQFTLKSITPLLFKSVSSIILNKSFALSYIFNSFIFSFNTHVLMLPLQAPFKSLNNSCNLPSVAIK
eukprot:282709_1